MNTTARLSSLMCEKLLQRNWGDIRASTMYDVKINKSIADDRPYVNEMILAGCFLYPPYIVGGSIQSRQQTYRQHLQSKFENNEIFAQFLAHLYHRTMEKGGLRFVFSSKPAKDTYGEALIEFLMANTSAINTIYEYLYPEEKRTDDLLEGE